MKASLGDILGGEIEIPASVQHYQVMEADGTIYCGGGTGAGEDLDRLMREKVSALWWNFWDSWPASCDWTVEWKEIEIDADALL